MKVGLEVFDTLEGGMIGGAIGLILGGVVLSLPSVGLLLAAGPLAAPLVFERFSGALGAVSGILVGFGVSDDNGSERGNL